MRSTRIGVGLTAAALAVALGASACSSSKSTAAPKAAPKSSVNDINPVDRSKLKQGGTLSWPIDQFSTQWNYNEADGPETSTANVVNALLPTPFHFDAGGTPTADTDYLAGEPTVTTVGGKQTVTYELNQKAKWSDGTSVTEADWAAQWTALNGKNSKYNVASTTGYDQISNVAQGKDKFEVVVTFASNFADWKSLFAPLYPVATNATPDAFNSSWLNKIPTTAGPFKFGSFNATDKTITVVRDPSWWGDPAILDSIVFKTVDIAATADAFASGEVDFFDIGPSATDYKKASGVKTAKIRVAGGPNFRHVTLNAKSPNLSDEKVRQAVAEAIDRGSIAKSDLAGLPWPDQTLNNHFYVNNQNGYQDNAGAVGKYDPAAAKQLLDAAGWVQGSGQYRTKDGKTLELKLVIPDGVKVSSNEGTLMQNFLSKVGIKLDINAVNSDDFFDKYINPGQFDMTVFSWIGTPFVSSNTSIYQNPQGTNIFQNFARAGSPAIDSLLNKMTTDLDPTQAIKDANAADAAIWQEAGVIPFYQRPDFVAEKSTLANFGAFGFADTVYQNIGFTG
jgi:peptide/nickel transport system substrate-binding protein